MSKKNDLDQYYTRPEIAEWCWRKVEKFVGLDFNFIEPSAGTGAFLQKPLNIEAFDLEPKCEGVVKCDFLDKPCSYMKGKVVVGNPPFGWASALAMKFLNHCKEAEYVCFILPRTFMKEVFQQGVDENLHLIFQEELPKNSFILDGGYYDVPCCFQIWKRKGYKRPTLNIEEYVAIGNKGDYNLRRVGGRAGVFVSDEDYTPSTTYKVKCTLEVKSLIEYLYPEIKKVASQTAGVRSITVKEINYILTKYNKGILYEL